MDQEDNIYFRLGRRTVALIVVVVLSLLCWFLFYRRVFPTIEVKGCHGEYCVTDRCIGRDCQVKPCYGPFCRGGNCVGENCQAGDCVGKNCVAGSCTGYGCKPGVCFDPDCPPSKCPQQNKRCTDGTAERIVRPFYYGLTKHFPFDTVFNPPICRNHLTLGDVYNGRVDSLNLSSIQYVDGENQPYCYVATHNQKDIQSDNIANTYPKLYKNDNCEFCIKEESGKLFCQRYKPETQLLNGQTQTNWSRVPIS